MKMRWAFCFYLLFFIITFLVQHIDAMEGPKKGKDYLREIPAEFQSTPRGAGYMKMSAQRGKEWEKMFEQADNGPSPRTQWERRQERIKAGVVGILEGIMFSCMGAMALTFISKLSGKKYFEFKVHPLILFIGLTGPILIGSDVFNKLLPHRELYLYRIGEDGRVNELDEDGDLRAELIVSQEHERIYKMMGAISTLTAFGLMYLKFK